MDEFGPRFFDVGTDCVELVAIMSFQSKPVLYSHTIVMLFGAGKSIAAIQLGVARVIGVNGLILIVSRVVLCISIHSIILRSFISGM